MLDSRAVKYNLIVVPKYLIAVVDRSALRVAIADRVCWRLGQIEVVGAASIMGADGWC